MSRHSIRRARVLIVSLLVCLIAAPALAGAAVIVFTHESFPAFQAQLAAGKVHAVTFNKKAHTVHVSLNNGQHMLASYPPQQYRSVADAIRAKGVPVAIEHSKSFVATTHVHHRLRYVAAGVLVVLVLVVAAVLALNKRRADPGADAAAAGDGPPSAAA